MYKTILPLLTAAVFCAIPPLRADVVFTDFVSGFSASCVVEFPDRACAAAFTPSGNFSMTDAEVKVSNGGTFDLFLYSDSSGLPGSSLGTIGTGTAPHSVTPDIVTVTSPALSLVSGTEYWLVMTFASGMNTVWVGGGSPAAPTAENDTFPGPGWGFDPAALQFQIDGVPSATTPEPATLGLFATGLLFAALFKKR